MEEVAKKTKPKTVVREQLSIVQYIKALSHVPLQEKIRLKNRGRPTPMLALTVQQSTPTGKKFSRSFKYEWYEKYPWMCGCHLTDRMYCFPCLIFKSPSLSDGIYSLAHLSTTVQKHVASKQHILSSVQFALLPNNTNEIPKQLITNQERIELARQNKLFINKIIDYIKYCACTDLSFLRNTYSNTNDLLKELHKFNPEINQTTIKCFLQSTPAYKNRLQILYENIASAMCTILQDHIKTEIKNTNYISLIAEDISEYTDDFYIILYFRFLDSNYTIQERLWGVLKPQSRKATSIAESISEVLDSILVNRTKLISQSYDGGCLLYNNYHEIRQTEFAKKIKVEEVDPLAVDNIDANEDTETEQDQTVVFENDERFPLKCKTEKSQYLDPESGLVVEEVNITDYIDEETTSKKDFSNVRSVSQEFEIKTITSSVADIIRQTYNYATCVPCHAYDFSTILAQILCTSDEFRLFFANVNMVFNFFADFNKKRQELRGSLGAYSLENIRWNMKLKLRIVFVNQAVFPKTLANLECYDFETVSQKNIVEMILKDEKFGKMLKFVNDLVNYGETFNDFHNTSFLTDVNEIDGQMKTSLLRLYHQYEPLDTNIPQRKRKSEDKISFDAILDNIIDQIKERCSFNFKPIERALTEFNYKMSDEVIKILPDYNEKKLRHELEVIAETKELKDLKIPIDMLRFMKNKNMEPFLSSVYSLLQIILTKPPVKLSENREDVFHKVKKFLADSKEIDLNHLPTLTFLSVGHPIFDAVENFNELIINEMALW